MHFCVFKICVILEFVIFSCQIYPVVDAKDILSSEEILSVNLKDQLKDSDDKNLTISDLNFKESANCEKSEHPWFSKIPLLPVIVATSNSIPEGSCKRQLHLYLEHLKNGTLWATEMFDSSAKYPYGLFDGSIIHFGSYDQCQRIQTKVNHKDGKIEEIRSRYCLVDVKYKEKNEPSISTGKYEIFFDPQESAWEAIRDKGDFRRYPRYFLQMALCFPAACKPEEIVVALKEPLENFSSQNNLQVEVTIPSINCTPEDVLNFSIYDKLFFFFCIIIIIFVIMGTIFHTNFHQDEKLNFSRKLLCCFSARRNIDEIFTINYKHCGFDCTHFFRVLFSFFIVIGHRQAVYVLGGNITGLYAEWFTDAPFLAWFQNIPIVVDGFFGLGGLVLSYFLLEYLDKPNKFNFTLMILKRFLRLSPLYMFITFGQATLFYYFGSGPLWESSIGAARNSCSSYWWANLLFVNNYFSGSNKCVIESWYLALDFQCYIIGLLLIGAFHKMARKIGYAFLGCCLICSMAIPFYQTFIYNLDPVWKEFITLRRIEDSEYFVNVYVKTHLRLSAYFVGLIAGAVIYDYKFASWRISKVWAQFVCVPLVIILFVVGPSIGYLFMNPNFETSAFQKALYGSLQRPLFSLCICLIPLFITMCDGLDFYYNLLTPKWVQPISKLSYAIYLIHLRLIYFELGSTRTPFTFSVYNSAKYFVGDITFTICFALLLAVSIEIPFKNIVNLLLNEREQSKTPKMQSNKLKKTK